MRARNVGVAVAIAVVAASVAIGDEVKRRDGTVIEGEIVKNDKDSVSIKQTVCTTVVVPWSDIYSVEQQPVGTLGSEMDKLRKETISKLEHIAAAAESTGKAAAATAARDLIRDVKAWTLAQRPREEPRAVESPVIGGAESREASCVDFESTCREWVRLCGDRKATEIQRRKSMDAYAESVNGRHTRASVVVKEVTGDFRGASVTVNGLIGERGVTLVFHDRSDFSKLESVKRGQRIEVEGGVLVGWSSPPEIQSVRIAK